MAYVIAEPCIGTKDNSCVEVCPVDCIHPTPDEPDYDKVEMLYIDPEECIDCDACVEACPVDACFAEDQLPEEGGKNSQINADYFAGKTWAAARPGPSAAGTRRVPAGRAARRWAPCRAPAGGPGTARSGHARSGGSPGWPGRRGCAGSGARR